jgi:hypothetical protein
LQTEIQSLSWLIWVWVWAGGLRFALVVFAARNAQKLALAFRSGIKPFLNPLFFRIKDK